jgi:hypothetical protein
VWDRAIFHNCPRLAVLTRDFIARLAKSIASSTVKKIQAARKAVELELIKGKGKAIDNNGINSENATIGRIDPLFAMRPNLQPYEPEA